MTSVAWEEGVALGLLRELGDPVPPMDAFGLAGLCGQSVELAAIRGAHRIGDVIYVSATARPQRQHGLIAHELGHWSLQRAGERDTEVAASYVGAALMLPRRPFLNDLKASEWDLMRLRSMHPNCSAELIARRVVALHSGCVSVWDNGRLKTRAISPWLPSCLSKVSEYERDLADRVLSTGETERADNLAWGFAFFEGPWRRVITLCHAEHVGFTVD